MQLHKTGSWTEWMTQLGCPVLIPKKNVLWLCPRRPTSCLTSRCSRAFEFVFTVSSANEDPGRIRGIGDIKLQDCPCLSSCEVPSGHCSSQGQPLSMTLPLHVTASFRPASIHKHCPCGPPTPAHSCGVRSLVNELSLHYPNLNPAGTLPDRFWKIPPSHHSAHD